MRPGSVVFLSLALPAATTRTFMSLRQFFLAFILTAMSTATQAQGLPPEVSRLVAVVSSIKGLAEVELGKTYLPDVKVEDLSLPGPYADLPIAALRRSRGALPEELLLSINFRIERNEAGLKGLEFISWWVRDQSRAGENMQIRSIGLPPIVAGSRQLGTTLSFTVDWFYTNPSQSMAQVLAAIAEKAKSLELATGVYGSAFQ